MGQAAGQDLASGKTQVEQGSRGLPPGKIFCRCFLKTSHFHSSWPTFFCQCFLYHQPTGSALVSTTSACSGAFGFPQHSLHGEWVEMICWLNLKPYYYPAVSTSFKNKKGRGGRNCWDTFFVNLILGYDYQTWPVIGTFEAVLPLIRSTVSG